MSPSTVWEGTGSAVPLKVLCLSYVSPEVFVLLAADLPVGTFGSSDNAVAYAVAEYGPIVSVVA